MVVVTPQGYLQISKLSVHMWKLISGLGREQSHSGPLEKDSAVYTRSRKGKEG